MRYLVTGGAGFIGSNIVDELLRRGQHVVVLDDLSSGKEENLAGVRSKIDFRAGSITDLATVQSACRGIDYVIHLAARTSVPKSVKDPIESNSINIDGTLNVLVAARDAKVRKVVYSGSSTYYGSQNPPSREDLPPQCLNPYALSKYVGEQYCELFTRLYGEDERLARERAEPWRPVR